MSWPLLLLQRVNRRLGRSGGLLASRFILSPHLSLSPRDCISVIVSNTRNSSVHSRAIFIFFSLALKLLFKNSHCHQQDASVPYRFISVHFLFTLTLLSKVFTLSLDLYSLFFLTHQRLLIGENGRIRKLLASEARKKWKLI